MDCSSIYIDWFNIYTFTWPHLLTIWFDEAQAGRREARSSNIWSDHCGWRKTQNILKSSNISPQGLNKTLRHCRRWGVLYCDANVTATHQWHMQLSISNNKYWVKLIPPEDAVRRVVSTGKFVSRGSFDSVPGPWLPVSQPCSDKVASLAV